MEQQIAQQKQFQKDQKKQMQQIQLQQQLQLQQQMQLQQMQVLQLQQPVMYMPYTYAPSPAMTPIAPVMPYGYAAQAQTICTSCQGLGFRHKKKSAKPHNQLANVR